MKKVRFAIFQNGYNFPSFVYDEEQKALEQWEKMQGRGIEFTVEQIFVDVD